MPRTQKELKAEYAAILAADVWPQSPRMVAYCVKESAYIVELPGGDIVSISRPRIEKNFCFGYSDSAHDTEDYDRANAMAKHARTNADYFMEENMRGLDEIIDRLKGNAHPWVGRICTPYSKQAEGSRLKTLRWDYWHNESAAGRAMTGAEQAALLAGYEVVREDFQKRLVRYLARYGMQHVRAWSYWQDA